MPQNHASRQRRIRRRTGCTRVCPVVGASHVLSGLELRNAMERAVALADGGEILAEHLPGDMADAGEGKLRDHVGSVERDAIIKALADNNYNQTHAARILGISRRALIYKMEKYGLKPPPAGKKAGEGGEDDDLGDEV